MDIPSYRMHDIDTRDSNEEAMRKDLLELYTDAEKKRKLLVVPKLVWPEDLKQRRAAFDKRWEKSYESGYKYLVKSKKYKKWLIENCVI